MIRRMPLPNTGEKARAKLAREALLWDFTEHILASGPQPYGRKAKCPPPHLLETTPDQRTKPAKQGMLYNMLS